jgi:cell division protein FtsL
MSTFKVMCLIALVAFFVLWVRTEVNRSGRTISQLQNEVGIKKARNQYLKLEILRLSGPEIIVPQAREKFGLEPIEPQRVVVVEE